MKNEEGWNVRRPKRRESCDKNEDSCSNSVNSCNSISEKYTQILKKNMKMKTTICKTMVSLQIELKRSLLY